jgi:hypothetical protein
MITIAIHESKDSDKVVKNITGNAPHEVEGRLTKYCSAKYASRIFNAYQNGMLYGCYFTKSNKVRAIFILTLSGC